MIRIFDETRPTAKFTPAELLDMHRRGVPLVAFEGKMGDGINLKAHDLGNGHIEMSGAAPTKWVELEWSPMALEMYLECVLKHREDNADELREKSLTIAANRAKSKVRKLCKAMGADTMLTLTYRANECSVQQAKKDLKEFVRRLRRVMPQFKAVAVYETQKRGAVHWHIATANVPVSFIQRSASGLPCKVKSFEAIRAIWRSVTGTRQGNIDIARRKASSTRSPAQIAAYIAKYIVKAFREGEAFSNRYSAFGAPDMPKPINMGHFPDTLSAWTAAYACMLDVHHVVLEKLSKWKDWFVLHGELPNKRRKGAVGLQTVRG